MLKIGLTGGIGSGKSTVARLFELLQIPVYYADDRSKWLLSNDVKIIQQLKNLFGNELYASDGKLNKAQLAGIVFTDANKLAQLNQLVHPAVFEDFTRWCSEHTKAPFIVKEAALVYETIIHQQLDKIIVVTAPESIRIARVMKRDQVSKEQVLQRISNQLPEAEKVKRADYVIYNDESKSVIEQTLAIQKQLLEF